MVLTAALIFRRETMRSVKVDDFGPTFETPRATEQGFTPGSFHHPARASNPVRGGRENKVALRLKSKATPAFRDRRRSFLGEEAPVFQKNKKLPGAFLYTRLRASKRRNALRFISEGHL